MIAHRQTQQQQQHCVSLSAQPSGSDLFIARIPYAKLGLGFARAGCRMRAVSRCTNCHLFGHSTSVHNSAVTYHSVCVLVLLFSSVLSSAFGCDSVRSNYQTFVQHIAGSPVKSAKMQSFVDVADSSDFTIHNLPYGVFSTEANVSEFGLYGRIRIETHHWIFVCSFIHIIIHIGKQTYWCRNR